jgi:hypothetical protein
MVFTTDILLDLGFQICGGQIDYKNVNYGVLTKSGPELTDDGVIMAHQLYSPSPTKKRRSVEPVGKIEVTP